MLQDKETVELMDEARFVKEKENRMKLTSEIVDKMKKNTKTMLALELPEEEGGDPELAKAFLDVNKEDLIFLTVENDTPVWRSPIFPIEKGINTTFRLRSDYENDKKLASKVEILEKLQRASYFLRTAIGDVDAAINELPPNLDERYSLESLRNEIKSPRVRASNMVKKYMIDVSKAKGEKMP